MITQAQIAAHERAIARFVTAFGRGLTPLINTVIDGISGLGNTASRTAILALFAPIRTYITETFSQLNTIVNSNQRLLSTEIGNTAVTEVNQLAQEAQASVIAQLDGEQQRVIQAVTIAAIAGLAISPLLSQIRTILSGSIKRLRSAFDFIVRSFDGALTLIRSRNADVEKFKYVGGVIDTSRDFCVTHNNKIYTRAEINRIWSSSSWGGKAPGNPFVVRGGYNCRHMFVPVKEETNASA
jgi:hypothetical protein